MGFWSSSVDCVRVVCLFSVLSCNKTLSSWLASSCYQLAGLPECCLVALLPVFYIGAWVRMHFEAFIRWTDKPLVILAITIVFAFVASTPHKNHLIYEILRFYIGGISGMWMVFCFFRHSASWLQRIHLSKPLQYVGTRTLDIYLLHYFFLPRFLLPYAGLLQNYNNSAIEFLVILSIALLVLSVTLLASYVIRLNHFLGRYLFGVKYNK